MDYAKMFNRRFLLKSLSAILLLPFRSSFACSGGSPVNFLQTVPLKGPPLQNQSLSEFISQYVGHSNWILDNEQLVGAKIGPTGKGNANNGQDYILETIYNWKPIIILPEEHEGYACTAIDVILERHLPVVSDYQKVAGTNEYIVRSKIATWHFPLPGSISAISPGRINFSAPGRVICISTLADVSGKKPARTIVTATRELKGYCQQYREVVPSYEYAISRCESLRRLNWSAHITQENVEAYVSNCKAHIQYE